MSLRLEILSLALAAACVACGGGVGNGRDGGDADVLDLLPEDDGGAEVPDGDGPADPVERDEVVEADAELDDGAWDDAETPPSEGEIDLEGCTGIDGIDEPCTLRYLFDPGRCSPSSPCRKLVVFFSGGEMDCGLAAYTTVLEAYARSGFVAVCAQLFQTSAASGDEPYNDEAPRVDLAVRSAMEAGAVRAVWSGEHLLISGVSHGATAPVIAMARTSLDDGWHGTGVTAACFFDGIYDIGELDLFLAFGDSGSPCSLILSHARAVGRYYDADPLVHSCLNDKCFCDPDHSPEMDEDTVSAVDPSELAVGQWKLIECGSAMNACLQDVVPAGPIEVLCSRINAGPFSACVYDPMPDDSHLECAPAGIDRCTTWFDSLLP
jgi:hypothetical protein